VAGSSLLGTALSFLSLAQLVAREEKRLIRVINHPTRCIPYCVPGRMVRVTDDDHDWGWGVLVGFDKIRLTAFHGRTGAGRAIGSPDDSSSSSNSSSGSSGEQGRRGEGKGKVAMEDYAFIIHVLLYVRTSSSSSSSSSSMSNRTTTVEEEEVISPLDKIKQRERERRMKDRSLERNPRRERGDEVRRSSFLSLFSFFFSHFLFLSYPFVFLSFFRSFLRSFPSFHPSFLFFIFFLFIFIHLNPLPNVRSVKKL